MHFHGTEVDKLVSNCRVCHQLRVQNVQKEQLLFPISNAISMLELVLWVCSSFSLGMASLLAELVSSLFSRYNLNLHIAAIGAVEPITHPKFICWFGLCILAAWIYPQA